MNNMCIYTHITYINMFPTYVRDVDISILSVLDHEDFCATPCCNKYMKSICDDDHLYNLRCHNLFGDACLDKDTHEKLNKMTWKGWYNYMITQKYLYIPKNYGVPIMYVRGYFNIIKWHHKHDNTPLHHKVVDVVTAKGYFEILKWCVDKGEKLPHSRCIGKGVEKGKFEIMEYIADREKTIFMHMININICPEDTYLKALKLLTSTTSRLMFHDINIAAEHGLLTVLQWAAEEHNMYPDLYVLDKVIIRGHLHVLKWIAANKEKYNEKKVLTRYQYDNFDVFIIPRIVNKALMNKHYDTVKWIADNTHILPDKCAMMWAAITGQIDILQWIHKEFDMLTDSSVIVKAYQYNQQVVIDWAKSII